MTNTTREFKRQLPVNATFQSMAFLIRVGVGIWLVPYLVDHLGTAAYGLIPIAALMTPVRQFDLEQHLGGAQPLPDHGLAPR